MKEKFTDSLYVSDWEIETDTGWQDIYYIHKTIPFQHYKIITETGKFLVAADNHILFDKDFNEVFLKDIIPNSSKIITRDGEELVIELIISEEFSEMFDVTVNDNNHRFYSNGILSHNSSIIAGYISWYILFNELKTAAILGNKQDIAVEIFGRVQFIIENLPPWLQQGIKEWNKKSLVLENGSKCFAASTSASAVRGKSINLLLLDEFAHLHPNLAIEFIASVFPTLSSSENSKLIITSTPNGLNHYHKIWTDAKDKKNKFVPIEGHWKEHPKRSQEWADNQRMQLGDVLYNQEVEAQFLGSSYTLIDGTKLGSLVYEHAIHEKDGLELFTKPEKDHNYVITVDVSRGKHLDYSAFSVFDVTTMPYKVVAIFKNNSISTLEYPHLLYNTARQYNNAFLLVEVNDLGEEVSNIIWYEYEYENIYFTKDNKISQTRGYPGVRTTTKVKGLGCSVLKELIEKDQLLVTAHRIIEELSIFVVQRKSYAAENTIINDDLCTTLWLFAWLTKQDIFQQVSNNNLRAKLTEQTQQFINESMTPFDFFEVNVPQEIINNDSRIVPTKEMPYYLTDDQRELLM